MNEAREVKLLTLLWIKSPFTTQKLSQSFNKSTHSTMAFRYGVVSPRKGKSTSYIYPTLRWSTLACLTFSWITRPFTTRTLLKAQSEQTVHQGHQSGSLASKAREVNLTPLSHAATGFSWSIMRARKVDHCNFSLVSSPFTTRTLPKSPSGWHAMN